jgi:hypothetical protein
MFYELDTKPYIYIYIKEGGGRGGHKKPVYKAP